MFKVISIASLHLTIGRLDALHAVMTDKSQKKSYYRLTQLTISGLEIELNSQFLQFLSEVSNLNQLNFSRCSFSVSEKAFKEMLVDLQKGVQNNSCRTISFANTQFKNPNLLKLFLSIFPKLLLVDCADNSQYKASLKAQFISLLNLLSSRLESQLYPITIVVGEGMTCKESILKQFKEKKLTLVSTLKMVSEQPASDA
jgi:hypothetical protein